MSSKPKSDIKLENKNEKKTDLDKEVKKSDKKPIESEGKDVLKNVKTNENQNKERDSSLKPSHSEITRRSSPAASILSTDTSSESLNSLQVLSQSYMKRLDQYAVGKHWDLGIEYNLSAVSGISWSLIITYFLMYEISDDCWDERFVLMSISLVMAAIASIHLLMASVVWYLTPVYKCITRSKVCLIIIIFHLLVGTLHLVVGIVCFGSRTCYQRGKLDKSLEHFSIVKYDVKAMAAIQMLVAISLFLCAMLLAIKRNDFKFYVLYRRGELNEYIMLASED